MKNIVYFSHGGGPLPILGDPSHEAMNKFMKNLPALLPKPEAIVVISAHWEEPDTEIIGDKNTELLFDYYGFPEESYELKYPVKGDIELAEKLKNQLDKNNIDSRIISGRGFDHGVFIPLMMMYPEADIPVVQVSLIEGLDPAKHILLGKALRDINAENVLIIGSGFSFHNMGAFRFDNLNQDDPLNNAFQDWLIDVCTNPDYDSETREKMLVEWESAPNARYCHPREEHLLPLHVCVGATDSVGEKIFDDYILGKRSVAFKW